MSEPAQLAKTAREHLAAALNALQSNAHVPEELMDIAEPIADAMGILHKIERSNGAILERREDALNAIRGSLDRLQKISVHHPAIDVVMDAVASSLSKAHSLVRYTPPAGGAPAGAQVARPRGDSVRPPAPSAAAYAAPAAAPVAAPPRHAPPPQPAPQPSFAAPVPAQAAVPYAPVPAPVPAGFGSTIPIQASPLAAQGAFPVAQPQAAGLGPTAALPQPPAPAPHQYAAPPAAQAQQQQQQQPRHAQPQHAQPQPQPQHAQPQPQPQHAQAQHAQPQHAQPQHAQPQHAQPQHAQPQHAAAAGAAQRPLQKGASNFDVELGTHSNSNFYKGLGGNDVIEHGGIFVATYKIPKIGAPVLLRVLLPGDLEFQANAVVQWTREGGVSGDSAEPGFGARFTHITPDGRQLVYRYTRNREPIFYDDL